MQQLTTLYISGLSNSFTADLVFGQPSSVASPRLAIVLLPRLPTPLRNVKRGTIAGRRAHLVLEWLREPNVHGIQQRGRVEGPDPMETRNRHVDNMDGGNADGKGTLILSSAENGVRTV